MREYFSFSSAGGNLRPTKVGGSLARHRAEGLGSRGAWGWVGGLYFGLLGLSNPIPPAGGRGRREGVFQLAEGGEETSPSWRLGGSFPRRGADQLGSRGA